MGETVEQTDPKRWAKAVCQPKINRIIKVTAKAKAKSVL